MNDNSLETFAVEYPCGLACRVEFDLSGIHDRYTYGQMRRAVDDCHREVHEDPDFDVRDEFTVINTRAREAVTAR